MGYFADKPKSLNDKLNDAALGLSDNIVKTIFPENVRNALANEIKSNLTLLEISRQSLADVPRLLQEEKPDIFYDECNFSVVTDFGGFNLRNPYCQPPPPLPPLPSLEKGEDCEVLYCNDGSIITAVLSMRYGRPGTAGTGGFPAGTTSQVMMDFNYDLAKKTALNTVERLNEDAANGTTIHPLLKNIRAVVEPFGDPGFHPQTDGLPFFQIATTKDGITTISDDEFATSDNPPTRLSRYDGNIECKYTIFKIYYDYLNNDDLGTYDENRYFQTGYWIATKFKKRLCKPPTPPPPQPPKMECCPQNEQLLKLILKRIGTPQKVSIFDEDLERKGTQKGDKIPQSLNEYLKLTIQRIEIVNRLLGIENYPMTVPDTMITPFKEGAFSKIFKFIDGEKKRKINSVTELIAWMSEQDSAVLGEFHQVIKFQTEDKKESSIVLPNVAEALKEIVLLSSQMAKQNNVQTELIFKIAAEIVATRAAASKGTAIVQDIQDYLDYPTERKTSTIPSSISLPKMTINKEGIPIATAASENHNNFLKPGEIKFVYEDWTGANSLHDQMLDILQLASMLRAIYFQRTDKG